jgi:hypothetical protein
MPLSDRAIKNAKPDKKPQRLFDGGGLYLEIAPAGGALVAAQVPLRRQGRVF